MLKITTKRLLAGLFFVLFLMFNVPITAQHKIITPADNALQLNLLKPFEITYHVTVQNKGKKIDFGLIIDQLKIVEINGNKYFLRIQKMPKISLIDTSINNFSNLSPVYQAGDNLSGHMKLRFNKLKVRGEKYFAKQDSLFHIDTKMPSPYFDSNMFEVVLSVLPLNKNFKAKIPYYQFETGGYTIYKAQVTGSKKIKNPDDSFSDTWILETTHKDSHSKFYISKKSRSVLRKEIIRSPQLKIFFERKD